MFQIVVGLERNNEVLPFYVEIEGCPRNGIEAIDFRRSHGLRSHGLPEEPSNLIQIPGFAFTDEAFCRAHSERCTGTADILLESYNGGNVYTYSCTGSGEVYKDRYPRKLISSPNQSYYLVAEPDVLLAYLKEQTPETAKALLLSLWGYTERSKAAAEKEAAPILAAKAAKEAEEQAKKQTLENARALLKDELDRGTLAAERVKILASFLSNVPEDAKRGTLKALTANAGKEAFTDLMEKVESASPHVAIFGDEEEEESEE